MVADVKPFERMKLHAQWQPLTLAYLGYLSGYEYVSVRLPIAFRALIHGLMTKSHADTVHGRWQFTIATLIERFANPALKHRTRQIAMDGPRSCQRAWHNRDRLVGTERNCAALGVAAWMRCVTGIDESDKEIDVKDPLAVVFRQIAAQAKGQPSRLVDGLLAVKEIFGSDLPRNNGFRSVVGSHMQSLYEVGAMRTVQRLGGAGR
jgi:fructuronate reductase